jgi:hypothetical protein
MSEYYGFENGAFAPLDSPPEEIANSGDTGDWHVYLASVGWHGTQRFPIDELLQIAEESMVEISIFESKGRRPDGLLFMFEIKIFQTIWLTCFCKTPLDALWLTRDWLCPLTAAATQGTIQSQVSHAADVLFDPDCGLECAQDGAAKEERHRAQLAQARAKRKEAAK